jgi:hypothetical protein
MSEQVVHGPGAEGADLAPRRTVKRELGALVIPGDERKARRVPSASSASTAIDSAGMPFVATAVRATPPSCGSSRTPGQRDCTSLRQRAKLTAALPREPRTRSASCAAGRYMRVRYSSSMRAELKRSMAIRTERRTRRSQSGDGGRPSAP